ncbi:hypothetical protein ACEQ8H_008647 [Pleosporales sp. CAS-2024a]
MAQVESRTAAVPETVLGSQTGDANKDALIVRLDELLEKYLHTLDDYQKLREQLSKQLSSGYLSLAQANFQNRSTTHYGQDNYDERMQAIRKVTVQDADRLSFSVAEEKSEEATAAKEDSEGSKKSTKAVDPLRWFGILVPPALRSAQADFIAAIEGPVPRLANVAKELRHQEIEIGRVRKQIKKL